MERETWTVERGRKMEFGVESGGEVSGFKRRFMFVEDEEKL